MPAFTCYKLHKTLGGHAPTDLDDYVDFDDQAPQIYGPAQRDDFTAKLYISTTFPHPPNWGGFIMSGFEDLEGTPLTSSVGAALIVKLTPENQCFAFTFGTTGRFLLKQEAWVRGYGLRAALNLIYPRNSSGNLGRLVAVDAKRRAGDIIRSRRQASKATAFEAFDVDKVRDLVGGATGKPDDPLWGRRITGADALHFEADRDFASLGKICRDLEAAHDRGDYKDRFSWLDAIRPVHDPGIVSSIEAYLAKQLKDGATQDLDLAPPEIVDWSTVVGFRYHFDARKKFTRPELRIQDFLSGVRSNEGDLQAFDIDFLRRKCIRALDSDNREIHKWSTWRCLSGEFTYEGTTYILDEGEIFAVSQDFLKQLNDFMSTVPALSDVTWPSATAHEDTFNKEAVKCLKPALLMDKKLVRASTQTTAIEVCDVLTADRKLIHVKRHLGSRDLSHLFSQGFVSARLLQEDSTFRSATSEKIAELTDDTSFTFFDTSTLHTNEFEVAFVILAPWRQRSTAEALPFFSKVNLQRTVNDLLNRGYRVSLSQVDTGSSAVPVNG